MLVLTRRLGQAIMIGDPKKPDECIEVTVVEVRGEQVRIGTSAPEDVKVHRTEIYQEIYEQVQQENRASAASAKPEVCGVLHPPGLNSSGGPSTVGKTLEQIRAMRRPS